MKKILLIILVLGLTVPVKAVNTPQVKFYPLIDGHFVYPKTPNQYLAGISRDTARNDKVRQSDTKRNTD